MIEYLYHYTNLSSLAMILKTKTLRLNSLKNMDDAEEMKTKNSEYLGKYCFVSSWTDDAKESIPLWGLYTYNMTGVRIKMRKNPFVFEQTKLYYYEDLNKILTDSILNSQWIHNNKAEDLKRKMREKSPRIYRASTFGADKGSNKNNGGGILRLLVFFNSLFY